MVGVGVFLEGKRVGEEALGSAVGGSEGDGVDSIVGAEVGEVVVWNAVGKGVVFAIGLIFEGL